MLGSAADKRAAFHPKHLSLIIMHGRRSIMVSSCFSWNGVEPIYHIEGNMDAVNYVGILHNVMLPYVVSPLTQYAEYQKFGPCKLCLYGFEVVRFVFHPKISQTNMHISLFRKPAYRQSPKIVERSKLTPFVPLNTSNTTNQTSTLSDQIITLAHEVGKDGQP